MRILILGGQGQIGSEFATLALSEIITLSRVECDITDVASVEQAIEKYQPDILVNVAAYTAVDQAEQELELAYRINCDGVGNLARLCVTNNLPLIHFSTDYIFDGKKIKAYVETDPPNPIGVYAKSKLEGEYVLQKLAEKYIIFRVSWVFGQHGKNFVKTILQLAKEKEELRIIDDQKGCPTSTHSIMDMVLKIANQIYSGKNNWGIFHYSNFPSTTWFEFAQEIINEARKYTNLKVERLIPIKTIDYPTLAKRPINSTLNCDKIKHIFNITSSDWRIEIKKVVQKYNFLNGS